MIFRVVNYVDILAFAAKNQIDDVGNKTASLKWKWDGHVSRMSNKMWAKPTTKWNPPAIL